ncbi:MAG: gliding motility-associated ABC transporter substrate-binding protein GldG [Bacteroidales bacterium]|jgi:ABC-2 type transport system permease protein|nr:gliding motility-associated ABC transporter substrate-binding protein GldG [Bacteroidales bacterium]
MKKKFSVLKTIVAGLIFVVAINILASFFYTRVDLTSEKRYTLSQATMDLLDEIDDYVYVKIMLTGKDLPMSFQRLRNETKEMLDEFAAHNKYIEYVFIDPARVGNSDDVMAAYTELAEKGLMPTDLRVNTKTGSERRIIFPGALINYKDREIPVQLLQTQMGTPSEEVLNNSIQSLEYNLSNAIRKLTNTHKSSVAIIEGYGGFRRDYYVSFEAMLSEYYSVSYVNIDGQLNSLANIRSRGEDSVVMENKYQAIIIPGPTNALPEKDKFVIDQYIMRGGKVLWLVEPVYVTMDSLQNSPVTLAVNNYTNLQDQLYTYGVRLEPQLIMDLQCLSIPLTTGSVGGRPQIEFFPWTFFPVLTPMSTHPIVKNLNAIKTEFISPVTKIDIPNVKHTVLLHSSQYSKIFATPDVVSLELLTRKPDQALFNKRNIPVAMLLEGTFRSLYDNRIPPDLRDNAMIDFLPASVPTAMVVVSDADMIKNQFRAGDGMPLNMGYDQYTSNQFGNPEFFLNVMNYLCDDSNLISVRSRELKLRILDVTKIERSSLKYQLINLIIPALIIILGGIIYSIIRKHRYSK